MSRVIITGGTGFLGQLLGRALLQRAAVKEVVLADVARPVKWVFDDLERRARIEIGDVADGSFCRGLFAEASGPVSVFHLGAIMSGQGETDFDLAMAVNLHGTLNMLEAARHCASDPRPRFVMASAGATLGSGAPTDFVTKDDVVVDSTRATPHTTYGMTKACAELLLSDYSRRGFVDGRGCRLPSVVVRAGAPNAAVTSIFSSIVREPLAGLDVTSPISPTIPHAVTGHRTALASLLRMHDLDAEAVDAVLGFDRTVFVPCVALSLGDLEAAVHRAVLPEARAALGRVGYAVDEALSAALASFPTKVDSNRAEALGLVADLDADSIVRAYAEDFPEKLAPAIRLQAPLEDATPGSATSAVPSEATPSDAPPKSVVLVTGGGSGIGRAVALRLAAGGWQAEGSEVAVVLTGRRVEALEETAKMVASEQGGAVHTLVWPADLTRPHEVDGLFRAVSETYGRLDVLFNNAGANVPPTSAEDMSLADWRSVVGINLDAAFHVARDAMRMMKAQSPQGGRIINNGSVSASSPRPGSIAYTASKHAITGLTKSIALDGRACNVACGQIDYGNVVSAISAGMAVGMPQADGSVRPEPRMSQTDAANAVHYMASLPLSANVLQMTVMATAMPFVGRG